jgi:SAM-dependent methyltransferase
MLGVPWYAKIAAKIVLSRVPLGYHLWRRLHIFRHGMMESHEYAFSIFKSHFDSAPFIRKSKGFVALEIGPGDTLFSAICSRALGAEHTYLMDIGYFATIDVAPYRAMADYVANKGLHVPDLSEALSLGDVLEACDAEYLTSGLNSLRSIASNSVDFIWSHAVLEHIRLHEFGEFAFELRRILRSDGACSHGVDLGDHLGGALNNLRFSKRWWESAFMANSGFYTNRIRYSEMVRIFESAGFRVRTSMIHRWERLPTSRKRMSLEFRNWPDKELTVRGFNIILEPI